MTRFTDAFKAMNVSVNVVLAIIAIACISMTSCDNTLNEDVNPTESLFSFKKDSATINIKVKDQQATRAATDGFLRMNEIPYNNVVIEMKSLYTNQSITLYGLGKHRIPTGFWKISGYTGPQILEKDDWIFSSNQILKFDEREIIVDNDMDIQLIAVANCAAIIWDLWDIQKVEYLNLGEDWQEAPYQTLDHFAFSFVYINPSTYPEGKAFELECTDCQDTFKYITIQAENGYAFPIDTSSLSEVYIIPPQWNIGGYGMSW